MITTDYSRNRNMILYHFTPGVGEQILAIQNHRTKIVCWTTLIPLHPFIFDYINIYYYNGCFHSYSISIFHIHHFANGELFLGGSFKNWHHHHHRVGPYHRPYLVQSPNLS